MGGELRLRDLDEDLLARLAERAAGHGRTMEGELREILRATLQIKRATLQIEEVAAETGRLAAEMERRLVTPSDVPGTDGRAFEVLAASLRKTTAGRTHTPSEILLRESRDER